MPQTPYVVQTTAVSSNQPGYHSASQPSYQPPPQAPFQPGMQGSYQLHPMQSAYPANTQQSYNMGTSYQPVPQAEHGRHSPANFPQPTAPPVGNTEPPPSYDSVTK
ncbi:uncharacterized protein LOC132714286 [Ruditapes philippinarum]|uniref:uncharacterized protein LOC132714286 n=1 Tax=Ruditapes philippinarum TaxID=129788 RepID=UPI00295AE0A6|nr:uncharacterized protein LOC132714286 [Ruditapes philippinarum]